MLGARQPMYPRRIRPGSLLACVAALAVVTMATSLRAEGRARAAPVPRWVDQEPADPRAGDIKVAANDGVVWLLSDRQYRVAATPERYARRAFRVDETTGIETISELHLDYDPSFEQLALHFVHILRDGKVIDALKGADWTVIQPESDLDRRIYSGELEGLLFLHDVRVGDVIDYAYTVRGANPVLGGHFVEQILLDEGAGIADLRRRIVTDATRTLKLVPHGDGNSPVETVNGPLRQYTWRRANVAAADDEDQVPSWYQSDGWVDVSDFASWNEVATSSAALFAARTAASPELDAQVSKWRSELTTEEARVLAATRFVQDEIRYLGIEIGPHSHQPFPAATVLQRRFGDCKDKSLLLVTLLRSLGVAADPALVNTSKRRMLDDLLPSPFAFDHAIVRAMVGGKPFFIDATASLQRGPLASRPPPTYERALVVSREAQGLIPIDAPRPKIPTHDVDETYTLAPPDGGPVQFDVVTTFRGDDADDMREEIANASASELGRRYLNYYASTYPEVRARSEPVFEDDSVSNVVVSRERYELPGFWQDGARELSPSVMEGRLKRPKIPRRHTPLGVRFPAFVAAHIHVKMGAAGTPLPEATDFHDDAVRFHASSRFEDGTLTLDYEYEALADSVPVTQVPAHLALLDRVDKEWTYTVQAASIEPATTLPESPSSMRRFRIVGGAIAFAASVGLLFAGLVWKRRRQLGKRESISEGEAATMPILVADDAEIDVKVRRARCACKGRLARTVTTEPMLELRLGERRIRAVNFTCQSCGQARRLYFEMKPT